MKFEQLYLFKEAIKYRSISVAAEKNYMSQSSISSAIINLEKELGTQLLRRTNTGVSPTVVGELVLEKTGDILNSVDEITDMAKGQQNAGEVSIACIPCMCSWLLPESVEGLRKQSGEIGLSVITGESRQVAHNVLAGISGFGILIYYEELSRHRDLCYTPLFHDEYVVWVGEKSPYWGKPHITYEELLEEPYIAYQDEFQKYNGGLTNMLGMERLPNPVIRTDNLDTIKNLILRNRYIAFFPREMEREDIYVQSDRIRRLPVCDRSLKFEVGYVESRRYRMKKPDKKVCGAIMQTIEEKMLMV